MQRYSETFRRYWWLTLFLVLVTPVALFLTIRPAFNYTARASLWIEHPVNYDVKQSRTFQVIETAVENHIQLMESLLRSPSFQNEVSAKIEATGYYLSPKARLAVMEQLATTVKVKAAGDKLLQITYNSEDERFSLTLLQGLIEAYDSFVINLIKDQGKSIIEYLTKEVKDLEQETMRADQAVQQYLAEHPQINPNDPVANDKLFPTVKDLEYQIVLEQQTEVKSRLTRLKGDLEQIQMAYDAFLGGQSTTVRVSDPPSIVDSFTYGVGFRLMAGGLVGLVGGILLSVLTVLVITWLDNSIRQGTYAEGYLKVRYIAALPQLGLRPSFIQRLSSYPRQYYQRALRWRTIFIGVLALAMLGLTVFLSQRHPGNGIVTPAIAILVVLIYRWPVIGFCLSTFLVSLCELFPTSDGISTFTVLPLTNIAAFTTIPLSVTPLEVILLGTLLATIIGSISNGRRIFDHSTAATLVWLFGAALLYGFVRGMVIQRGDLKAAQVEIRGLVYIVLVYFIATFYSDNPRLWKILNWLIPIGITLQSLLTIWRAFVLPEQPDAYLYVESLNGFNHDTAILFVVLIMWCLTNIVFNQDTLAKVAGYGLLVPALAGMVLSNRRSAFASLAGGLLVFMAILCMRRRKTFIVTAIILAISFPPYVAAFKNVQGPLGMPARAFSSGSAPVGSRDYNSDLYRLVEKTNVLMTIKESPLLGGGFGQPFHRYNSLVSLEVFAYQYYTAHVQVMWLWLKLGMIGWMIFWLLVCQAVFKLGQIIRYDKPGPRYYTAILSGYIIVSIMIYAYVDLSLVNPRLMTLMAIGIGTLEMCYRAMPRTVPEAGAVTAMAVAAESARTPVAVS